MNASVPTFRSRDYDAAKKFYVEERELLSRGVLADAPPQDQPWGNRELQLSDPDGNRLRICTVRGDQA